MLYEFLKHKNTLPILLGIALFGYLVLRVFLMPISDDESITVIMHATMNCWDVMRTAYYNLDWTPNNHVLNTLFVKLELSIFGRKDWAVRLHILASFVICYYYGTKIIQLITPSRIRQLLYLLILFFNPYLLDFFGIARGYAMSMAGFTAAFYYFLLYTESLSVRHLRISCFALFLAVWSNFSALYLMALVAILFYYEIYKNKEKVNVKQHLITIATACFLTLIIIIVPLMKTLDSPVTFGGTTGLFQDCIVNYVNQFISHNSHVNRHAVHASGWKYIELAGAIFFSLWFILQLISLFIKAPVRLIKLHMYSLFLVIGVAVISKILFIFYETPYPTARTQLLFSIPFYLSICVAFERIIAIQKRVMIVLWFIVLSLSWHFAYSVSFENTIEWWQNGDAKRLVAYLKDDLKNVPTDQVPKLGVESWQYPGVIFYTEVEFKDVMTTHWTNLSTNENWDYLFVAFHLSDKVWDNYEPVKKLKHCTLYKLRGEEVME